MPLSKPVQITLLSSILGSDFPLALERQQALGLRFLDLKDGLWSKSIERLDDEEADRAASLITQFGFEVHCFSTSIGLSNLEPGSDEIAFRALHEPAFENALRVAKKLRPRVIRLLPPRLSAKTGEAAMRHVLREFPWLPGVY